jgi:hypothetical protein
LRPRLPAGAYGCGGSGFGFGFGFGLGSCSAADVQAVVALGTRTKNILSSLNPRPIPQG